MRIFNYVRGFSNPTDKYALEIYKSYVAFKKEVLESWIRGVTRNLLAERQWIDLKNCRLHRHVYKESHTTVLSLQPIIGSHSEAMLENYEKFFDLYNQIISDLSFRVIESIGFKQKYGDKIRFQGTTRIIYLVNILKLMIAAMNTDKFVYEDFKDFAAYFEKTELQKTAFTNSLRELDLGVFIGEKFEKGGSLTDDIDHVLIGAFFKHARRGMGVSKYSIETPVKQNRIH